MMLCPHTHRSKYYIIQPNSNVGVIYTAAINIHDCYAAFTFAIQ